MQFLNFWKNNVFILLVLIFLPLTPQAEESVIATGIAPLMDNVMNSRQEAIDTALAQAVMNTVKIVYPYAEQIRETISPPDFIQNYSIVQEEARDDIYRIQIEAKIDWRRLARKLANLGIINSANGEKILLFFTLPEDIDFKTQVLSFWKQFFLVFGFNPMYEEMLTKEKILDYAFQKGIPFIFNLSIKTCFSETGQQNTWKLEFTQELIYTTYNETISREHFKHKVFAIDIEKLTQIILYQTQNMAYEITPKLSVWLGKYKRKGTNFELVFIGISKYKDIFDIYDTLKDIKGITGICIKEVTEKKVVYTGIYKGLLPDLVNQLSSLGFVIEQVRGRSVCLRK